MSESFINFLRKSLNNNFSWGQAASAWNMSRINMTTGHKSMFSGIGATDLFSHASSRCAAYVIFMTRLAFFEKLHKECQSAVPKPEQVVCAPANVLVLSDGVPVTFVPIHAQDQWLALTAPNNYNVLLYTKTFASLKFAVLVFDRLCSNPSLLRIVIFFFCFQKNTWIDNLGATMWLLERLCSWVPHQDAHVLSDYLHFLTVRPK
jgi:hypothetical protein